MYNMYDQVNISSTDSGSTCEEEADGGRTTPEARSKRHRSNASPASKRLSNDSPKIGSLSRRSVRLTRTSVRVGFETRSRHCFGYVVYPNKKIKHMNTI